jgi:hypothetical protein
MSSRLALRDTDPGQSLAQQAFDQAVLRLEVGQGGAMEREGGHDEREQTASSVRERTNAAGNAALQLSPEPSVQFRTRLTVRPVRALRGMPFSSPGARRFTRPAPEGAGESAGLRIRQGRRDLRERHFSIFQQLPGNLEADLVR